MPEASWEKHADSRTRLLKWTVIMLPLAVVAGIIIYNNRDLISDGAGSGKSGARDGFFPVGEDFDENAAGEKKLEKAPASAAPASGAETPAVAVPVVRGTDSVEINDVVCGILNRRDIRVCLFITACCDPSHRRDVLLKRDALAVVTQKVLSRKDFEEIKIDKIKGELLRAMNALFEDTAIADIAIRSIKIEKVSRE